MGGLFHFRLPASIVILVILVLFLRDRLWYFPPMLGDLSELNEPVAVLNKRARGECPGEPHMNESRNLHG